jgi:hypothetical protein
LQGGETYGIDSCSVLPRNAFWRALRQQNADLFFACHGRQHERCLELGVPAYELGFVAGVNEEFLPEHLYKLLPFPR